MRMTARTTTMRKNPTMTDGTATARKPSPFYRFRSLSMRRRIVGSVAALSALGLLGAGSAALLVARERIEERVDRLLAQEIAEFRELAGTGVDPETGRPFNSAERLLEVSMQRNVPDTNETHLGFLPNVTLAPVDGAGALASNAAFRADVTRHSTPAFGEADVEGEGRVTYAVLPFTKEGRVNHYVATYFTDREMGDLNDMIRTFAVAAVLAWAALVFVAWLLTGRILRPVHELRDTAALISDSDLNRRIEVRGDDELAALGRTFNGMLDRLQEALGSQRRMLDDAGHELRTPITVVRGNLEVMDSNDPVDVENAREIALDELDRMSGLVEDLMVLAKARLPEFLSPEPTDVGELVRRIHDKAQALGPRTWQVETSPSVLSVLDPNRITQALLQLASNAVAVTHEGDVITLGCATSPAGVQMWVRDNGPGVPPAQRLRIFDRWEIGATGNAGAGGTGLGLPIVKAIATAHGGSTWVTASGPAGGAMFVIEVPIGDLAEEQDDCGDCAGGHDSGTEGDSPSADTAYMSLDEIFDETTTQGQRT